MSKALFPFDSLISTDTGKSHKHCLRSVKELLVSSSHALVNSNQHARHGSKIIYTNTGNNLNAISTAIVATKSFASKEDEQ